MSAPNPRLVRFGAALQALRMERGYSRAALARCAGLTEHHLIRVERGDAPLPVATVVSLARSLGVTVYSLSANYEATPTERVLEEIFAIEYGA
jgi:transcriptional regulator with XRE-family HTH domain